MKKFTKMFCTLLMATLLVLTSFAHTVSAAGSSDKSKVTISNVENGAKVKLYTVVTAEYTGTAPNEQFTGYKLVNGLVDPSEPITVTNGTDTKIVEASLLDVNPKDGKVDATYTDGGVTWTVDPADQKVIYNMNAPTQEQILRVVADGLLGTQIGSEQTAADNHVTFEVPAGQYIALIDSTGTTPPPNKSKSIYSPVVVSAGYTQVDRMKRAETTTSGTHYKLVNGGYTDVAPTADNYFLYENAALDGTNVVFSAAETFGTISFDANDPYVATYEKDGSTTVTELVGKDLDLFDPTANDWRKYDWTLEGNSAIAKRQDGPDIEKEINPSNNIGVEEVDVKVVAVGEDSNALRDAANNLLYIHKSFTVEDYMKVLGAVADSAGNPPTFKLDGGKYVPALNTAGTEYVAADGTTVLTKAATLLAMTTPVEDDALTVPKTIYSAAVGTEIEYKLTPTIPNYPANAKDKVLTVVDKMSDALDFKVTDTNNANYLPVRISFKSGKTVEHVKETDGYSYYVALGRNVESTDTALVSFNENLATINSGVSVMHQGGYLYKDATGYHVITDLTAEVVGNPIYQFVARAFVPAPNPAEADFQVNFAYYGLPGAATDGMAPEGPVIEYTGILNEKAVSGVEGAVNVAKFYYNNKPGQDNPWNPNEGNPPTGVDTDVSTDTETVVSFELSFRKTNDKDEFIAAPASTTEKKYYMIDETVLNDDANKAFKTFIKKNGTPMYRKESAKPIWFAAEDLSLVSTTDPIYNYEALVNKDASNAYIRNPEFAVLEGAVFGVYPTQECNDADKLFEITTNEFGIGIVNSGQNGLVKKGTYYLKEIKAPEGYALSNVVTPVEVDWTTATTTTKTTNIKRIYTAIKEIAPFEAPATEAQQVGWLTVAPGQQLDNATYVPLDTYSLTEWEDAYMSTLPDVEVPYNGNTYTVKRVVIDGKEVYKAYLLSETVDIVTSIEEMENAEGLGTVMVGRINNTKTSELPSTGGIGTYMFTIAGVAILSLAAFMLVFRKKEARQ